MHFPTTATGLSAVDQRNSCSMVCLIPAIVISASRRALVILSATVITTVPLPLPDVVRLDPVAPAALLSFMGESRRLLNAKMKRELGVQLLYPTVYQGVPATAAKGGAA